MHSSRLRGQAHPECRTPFRGGFDTDGSTVGFHDPTDDEEPESGPLLFRGEVGSEEPGLHSGVDSDAVVDHRPFDAASVAPGLDHDAPPFARGVDRIEYEVEDHLHELIADADDERQIARHPGDDVPVLPAFVIFGNAECLFDHFRRRDFAEEVASRAAEGDEFPQCVLYPSELTVGMSASQIIASEG